MVLPAPEIIERLRKRWPGIHFVWMPDKFYVIPPLSTVESLLQGCDVSRLRGDGELVDCDDYSLFLNTWMKKKRIEASGSIPAGERYHLAFGEAFGGRFRGVDIPHSLNICIALEGVFFIEPQTYDTWMGDLVKDLPLLIRI